MLNIRLLISGPWQRLQTQSNGWSSIIMDERPSVAYIGFGAVISLILGVCLIVIIDLCTLLPRICEEKHSWN